MSPKVVKKSCQNLVVKKYFSFIKLNIGIIVSIQVFITKKEK